MGRALIVGLGILMVTTAPECAFGQQSGGLEAEPRHWIQVNFEKGGKSYSCKKFDIEIIADGEQILVGTYKRRFRFSQGQSDVSKRASSVTVRVRCGKRVWIFSDLRLMLSPSTWTFGLDTKPYSNPHEIELDREYNALWIKTMQITDTGLETTDFRRCASALKSDPKSTCNERWSPISTSSR